MYKNVISGPSHKSNFLTYKLEMEYLLKAVNINDWSLGLELVVRGAAPQSDEQIRQLKPSYAKRSLKAFVVIPKEQRSLKALFFFWYDTDFLAFFFSL